MAVSMRHKKARTFRDFLISTDSIKMFKEDEVNNAVLFRSVYPVKEDEKKQFMIMFDDSIYINMQSLLIQNVPEEKRDEMLKVINQLHFEFPTVKYVLTKEGHVMTSMAFHGTDQTMDPKVIFMCTIEFFKMVAKDHYERLTDVLK